jgi:hypothetical protein
MLAAVLMDSAGASVRDVRTTQDVFVRTTFRIDTPGAQFRAGIKVVTEGITAFQAVAPERTTAPEPGLYAAVVRIPANLLADASYSILPRVTVITEDGWTKFEPAHPLTMRVHSADDPESAQGTFKGTLKGVVRPKLEWNVERETLAQTTRKARSLR